MRADLKTALSRLGEARHELLTPLPLVPLVPKAVARRLEGLVIGTGVIGSSNLGQFDPAANRPDGTDADHFAVRMAENLTWPISAAPADRSFRWSPARWSRSSSAMSYTNAEDTTTREQIITWVRDTLEDFELTAHIE